MKKSLFFLLTFCILTFAAIAQTAPLPKESYRISISGEKGSKEVDKLIPLNRGEIITFETIKELNSDNVQLGDVIPLRVAKPVTYKGYRLINQGAYGEAIVREVKKARGFGRSGKIVLEVMNVTTFDGHRVRVNAQSLLIAEGHNRKGLAWLVSIGGAVVIGTTGALTLGTSAVFLGLPCVSFGLVRGEEAVVKQGKILSGVIKDTIEVGADPSSANQVYQKD